MDVWLRTLGFVDGRNRGCCEDYDGYVLGDCCLTVVREETLCVRFAEGLIGAGILWKRCSVGAESRCRYRSSRACGSQAVGDDC